MRLSLLDPGRPASLWPLTQTRDFLELRIANSSFRDLQRRRLSRAGFNVVEKEPQLFLRGDWWLSERDLERLMGGNGGYHRLLDNTGNSVAWTEGEEKDAEQTGSGPLDSDSFCIRYPWDLLRLNRMILEEIQESRIEGEVSAAATIDGILHLGRGSCLLPGVFVEGTVVIGQNCRIGPNCYLRGMTSIGNDCRIGQAVEIKNSILGESSAISHLSYCGDSILGCGVNFGAGTITANYRHDGKFHYSVVEGELLKTERSKLGAIVGDDVHTGIHTSIYPGRKLGAGSWTRPGDVVQRDLE